MTAPHDDVDRLRRDRQSGRALDVDQQVTQDLGRQQAELEMLRATLDRRQHLLRIGGREDERDVRGRLFERLQQRVRRRGREHVHLVDDVHLAPRGGAEAEVHALDEVAHGVDAVVRGRVELDEVEEGAARDRQAVLALAAGLAVGAEIEAVQRAGEDARGGRLAGATRTGEEVGVAGPLLAHRVAKRVRDVTLTDELREVLGPVLAVERRRHLLLRSWPLARPGRSGPVHCSLRYAAHDVVHALLDTVEPRRLN